MTKISSMGEAGLALSLAFLLPASPLAAGSRSAQCLLEVKGTHYLGGQCRFTPIDKIGSFRITDELGLNLVAQINAFKKDEGKAIWNGPLGGNTPAKELGEAYRSGGCWIVSDSDQSEYNDSRICAWSPRDRVYVGPSPRTPKPYEVIYYGSRVGMYDDIVSRDGINSSNATIVTKPSKDGAVSLCREYSRDYSIRCIEEELDRKARSTLRGNCKDKTFSDQQGNRFAFLGKPTKKNDDFIAEYLIKDLSTGEMLDGSSASGYDVRLDIFRALCPDTAPRASN